MIDFPLYETDTAPAASRPHLEALTKFFGFLPNHGKVLAESPAAARAYLVLNEILAATTFTPIERNALLIAISVEHRCDYCVSAHTTLLHMAKAPQNVIDGLRRRTRTGDARIDALVRFARAMVENRGWADDREVQAFLDAGFTREQIFEVCTALSLKTLTNYANHLAGTPLDEIFIGDRWNEGEAQGDAQLSP
jgi:AhpD family alkylhydroperoxidase